jgi:hypothetical protein
MRSPIQPQKKAPGTAPRPAETRGNQDYCRLAIGQLPLLQDEGQHIADEKEVKEIQHIADICSGDDLPLIGRQFFLIFQALQHDVPSAGRPRGRDLAPPFIFGSQFFCLQFHLARSEPHIL